MLHDLLLERLVGDRLDHLGIAPADLLHHDNAELAVNGLARLMCMQHSYYGQGASGEGWIKYLFGNFPGQNFSVPRLTGWSSIMNMSYHQRNTSSYDSYGWYYYYRIIDNANMIIGNIDDVPTGGDPQIEARKTFIKAQALVYRAYGHFQLTQLYSHRWMDTNHGDADGVIIRTESRPREPRSRNSRPSTRRCSTT